MTAPRTVGSRSRGGLEAGVEYGYTISVYYQDGRVGSTDVSAVTPMPALPTITLSRTARMAGTQDVFRLTPCARRTTGGPAPSAITAVSQSPGSFGFTWPVYDTGVNYVVDRAPEGTTNWVLISSTCGGPSPIGSYAGTMGTTDAVGGIQPSQRYTYRVTAIGPNGETGWNTIHWTAPCQGRITVAPTVQGSTVTLTGSYLPCGNYSSTPHITDATHYAITSSYGYVKQYVTTTLNKFTVIVYGVPVGTHTFTVVATWYNGGQSSPGSTPVTVSY